MPISREPWFLTPLNMRDREDGTYVELLTPLVYRDEDGTMYVVPAGFVSDFASIPRGLWNIFPKFGKHNRAAVLHDYLCVERREPHEQVHRIFRTALRACGVNRLSRNVMYAAVAAFGPKWEHPKPEGV